MSEHEQMSQSTPEQRTVIHHMRMSKADDADMDVTFRLIHLVDAIGDDYYPGRGEKSPTFFDEDNFEHLQHLYRQIKEIAENSGSLHRIAGAASVLLNPKNNLIDPDDHCIELHPDLKAAQQAADEVEGLRAKVAELEAQLAALKGQKPEPELVQHRKPLDDFDGSAAGLSEWKNGAGLSWWPHRKLYARPVPAEPVNARLVEALERIADPRNFHFAGDAQVVAREALAAAEAKQAEPVRLTDEQIHRAFYPFGASANQLMIARSVGRAVELLALRANGFKVEGEQ